MFHELPYNHDHLMKTCTYCKEKINEEATKCRYCCSVVNGTEKKHDNEGRYVTYILDRDLVRFIKVASSFLAVFLIVGAFLYGFDLKQASKEIRDAQKESLKAYKKMKETEHIVSGMLEQVRSVVDDAKAQFAQIQESSKQAEIIVVSLQKKHRAISQTITVQASEVKINLSIARDKNTKLWVNGAKLRISFMGGDKKIKEKIIRVASQWLETANLKFDFGTWKESEIRIGFRADRGIYSYVGSDALNVPQNEATMNLGWFTAISSEEDISRAEENISRVVLQQFGHALGLYNEHQNPNVEIPWDIESIKREMSGPPNFWSIHRIERQFLYKWPADAFPIQKEFDPDSVMFQISNKNWLKIELPDRKKTTLSKGDKEFISGLYPKQ